MDNNYYFYGYEDYDDEDMTPDNGKLYSAASTLAQQYYKETGDGIIDSFYSFDLPDMVAYLGVSEENKDIIPVVMQELSLSIRDILPATSFYKMYPNLYSLTFMDLDDKFIGMIIF